MANVRVDGLEVEIRANSEQASTSIQKLIAKMTSLKAECERTIPQLSSFCKELSKIADIASIASVNLKSMESTIGKVARNASKIANEFTRAKDAVEQTGLSIYRFQNFFTFRDTPNDFEPFYGAFSQPLELPDFNVIDSTYRIVEDLEEASDVVEEFRAKVPQIGFDMAVNADKTQLLKWRLEGVKKALEEVLANDNGNTERIASLAEKYQKIKAELDGIGDSNKRTLKSFFALTDGVERHRKSLGMLWSSLKRIALYRALRGVIKSITDAMRVGVTDVYRFSQAMDGEFFKKMDALHSITLQMKNQFGSAFSELIIAVKPFLDMLISQAIKVADTISQIFAYINGDSVYKKAKYYETAWDDASASAKKYKDMLLGIDELNILNDNKGSGKAGEELDYSQMFEYAEISNGKWKTVVDYIKDNFDIIKTTASAIGSAILAWKVAKAVTNFISDFQDIFQKVKVPLGLTLMVTGFGLEFGSSLDIGKNGANVKNVLGTLIGGALGVGGGVLAFGASSLFFTIPMALTIPIIGIAIGYNKALKANFENSELGSESLRFDAEFQTLYADNVQLKARIESITTEIDSATLGQLDYAQDLINKIFDMDANDSKTSGEILRIKSAINELNGMNLDGISLAFDDSTGHVTQTKLEIEKAMEALKEQYKLEAMKEAYIESYKAQYEAEQQVAKATKELDAQLSIRQELREKMLRLEQEYNSEIEKYNEALNSGDNTRNLSEWSRSIDNLRQDYNQASHDFKEVTKIVEDQYKQFEEMNGTLEIARDKYLEVEDAIDHFESYGDDITAKVAEIREAFKEATTEVNNYSNALNSLKNLDGNSTRPYSSPNFPMRQYADGGVMPNDGQLFVANESGAELVGSWGRGSAVANGDQIISGIQSGVSSAVSSVLAPYLAQIAKNTKDTADKDTSVYIGDRDIARANNRGQRMLGARLITS